MTSTRPRLSTAFAVFTTLVCLLVGSSAATAQADEAPPRTPIGGALLGSSGFVVSVPPGTPALPKTKAKSFLLADLTTGDVLAAKNPHGRFRPASAIKVLTAVTLLPRLDPAQVYKATFADANVIGSKVGIVPNATYPVHNLFEGMFLVSGNDAARALAGAAGGLPATVRQMNETARRLGALDTSARNTSGLDEPGQYSSAYDLALFARAGMQRSDFRAYARTVKSHFPAGPAPAGKTRRSFEIYTQNKLMLNYPGAIGIKTGWTTQARGTFIGAASRNGRTLVVTVMNTGQGAWREAAALLDWGFANAVAAEPVGTLDAVAGAGSAARGAGTGTGTGTGTTTAAGAAGEQASTTAGASSESASSGRSAWGWLWWTISVLVGALVALRARVLVRRKLRRRRRAVAPIRRPRQQHPVRAGVRRTYGDSPVTPLVPTAAPAARATPGSSRPATTPARVGRSA